MKIKTQEYKRMNEINGVGVMGIKRMQSSFYEVSKPSASHGGFEQ